MRSLHFTAYSLSSTALLGARSPPIKFHKQIAVDSAVTSLRTLLGNASRSVFSLVLRRVHVPRARDIEVKPFSLSLSHLSRMFIDNVRLMRYRFRTISPAQRQTTKPGSSCVPPPILFAVKSISQLRIPILSTLINKTSRKR